MSKRVHIIVVESSAIIRCGLVTALQRVEELKIDVAEASSISSIASISYGQIPDVLIVNPSYVGLLPLDELKSESGNENLKVLALQSSYVEQGLLSKYDGVISINDSVDTIVKLIEGVIDDDASQSVKELSAREKEIIVCVVKGMINKQIADELCISTHTVITHRKNIANKLKIHSPSGLTIYAIVNNLVDLADIKNTIVQNK